MTTRQQTLSPAARPVPAGIKVTGWALVLAPLLIVAGEVLHPLRSTVPAQQLAIVAQHPGAWYVSHLLLFAGIVLTLPAVAGLVFLLGGHARRLAAVGAGLAFTGIVCFAGLLTIGFVVWQMASQDADRSQMAALFSRLFHAPGFFIPFQALPLTFAVGMVILAIALDRNAALPRWVTLSLGAGATGLSLVGIVPGAAYAIAASAVLAAGMAPIGKTLLTGTTSPAGPARRLHTRSARPPAAKSDAAWGRQRQPRAVCYRPTAHATPPARKAAPPRTDDLALAAGDAGAAR